MADIGIKISATDAASGVFKSVASEAGKLQGAIGSVSSSIGAFATTAVAGLSVLSFASQIKQAIDLADSFNKLSQKTGVAVDELSKLNYAAGLADVGTDALATGLKKLNLNISAAASGSKEQAALFKSLGVSIQDAQGNALSADKVFAQLSDKFAESADGANKTAVAVALLGKNGADLVPLLNGGSQALKDLGDEATKLGIVLGPDFAKKAEDFNDNLHKISLAGQGLAVSLGDNLVTLLGEMSSEMAKAAVESGKLAAVWAGFETFWYGPKLLQANKLMLEQTEKLTSAETELANARASGNANAIRWQQTRVDWLKTEIAKTTELRNTLESDKTKKTASAAAAPKQDSDAIKRAAAALYKPVKAPTVDSDSFVAGRDAAKDWAKSFTEFRKTAAEASAEVDGLSKAQAQLLTYLGSTGYTNASEPMRQLALAEAYAAINAEELARATKLSAKEALEAVNSYADSVEAQQKAADTLREQVVAEREHVAAIGLSTEAIAELVAVKYEDQAVSKERLATIADTVDATGLKAKLYRQEAKDLRELAALKRSGALKETIVEANKKIDEENKRTAEKLESAITDGLMRGFENGKTIAENFRDTVENIFKTMVIRPVVQATVNAGLGALGIPGVGGSSGGAGGLLNTASNINSIYGTASQFFAGSSAGASAASLIGANAVGAAGGDALGALIAGNGGWAGVSVAAEAGAAAGAAAGTAAVATGAAGAGAGAAGAGALGIPGIGWALGGLLLLGGLMGDKKWETKYGGSFDNTGPDGTINKISGPGTGGEFPKQYAQNALKATEIGINETLKMLGSKARLGYFSAGAESSGEGQAFANAGGKIKLADGSLVEFGQSSQNYGYMNRRGNFTPEEAAKAYAEELQQATLQALQKATDIPKAINAKLAGVNIDDLTGDALTNFTAEVKKIITDANALQSAMALLPFGNLKDLSFDAAAGLLAAAGGFDKLNSNITSYYDAYYSAEEKRAQTIKNVTLALGSVGLSLPATRDAFRALVDSQDLTTESGQKAYAALMDVNGAFAGITTSAEDAATALAATRKSLLDAATGAASAAQTALQRSIEAQRTSATAAKDVAAQSVAELSTLVGTLQDSILSLRGSSQPQQSIASMLQAARATGYLPSESDLRSAISASVQDVQQRPYASAQEADFARATLAAQLGDLQDIGGDQLSKAKDSLTIAQQQLDQLDSLERVAQQQLDAANGTLTAILSLSDAIKASTAATQDLMNVRASQGLTTGAVTVGGALQSVAPDTARLASINQYINTLDFSEAGAANSVQQLYAAAQQYGVNQAELAAASGYRLEDVQKLFAKHGIPAFEIGTNYVPRDTLAMLHEGEAVVPKAYNPAAGGGGNNDKLLAELIGEVRRLRAQVDVLNDHGKRTADATNGRPEAPVLVEIA